MKKSIKNQKNIHNEKLKGPNPNPTNQPWAASGAGHPTGSPLGPFFPNPPARGEVRRGGRVQPPAAKKASASPGSSVLLPSILPGDPKKGVNKFTPKSFK